MPRKLRLSLRKHDRVLYKKSGKCGAVNNESESAPPSGGPSLLEDELNVQPKQPTSSPDPEPISWKEPLSTAVLEPVSVSEVKSVEKAQCGAVNNESESAPPSGAPSLLEDELNVQPKQPTSSPDPEPISWKEPLSTAVLEPVSVSEVKSVEKAQCGAVNNESESAPPSGAPSLLEDELNVQPKQPTSSPDPEPISWKEPLSTAVLEPVSVSEVKSVEKAQCGAVNNESESAPPSGAPSLLEDELNVQPKQPTSSPEPEPISWKEPLSTAVLEPVSVSEVKTVENLQRAHRLSAFKNVGNTCFLASALQVLLHLPLFLSKIYGNELHAGRCSPSAQCVLCALHRLIQVHQVGGVVDPTSFINEIRVLCPGLLNGKQQDSHEFLNWILGQLPDNDIDEIFQFIVQKTKICNQCALKTVDSSVRSQQLCLEVDDSVGNSIVKFLSGDMVHCWCDKCKCDTDSVIQFEFQSVPKFLLVQLKRFDMNGLKQQNPVHVQQTMNLNGHLFELYGAIVHQGEFVNSGHYYCKVRWEKDNGATMWSKFNDDEVTNVNCEDFNVLSIASEVYVMVYKVINENLKGSLEEMDSSEKCGTLMKSPAYTSTTLKSKILTVTPPAPAVAHINRTWDNFMKFPGFTREASQSKFLNVTPPAPIVLQGRPFQSQLQETVCRLYFFTEAEASSNSPIIPLNKPRERVCAAAGISDRTLSKYLSKLVRKSPFATPGKVRPTRVMPKRGVDKFVKDGVRRTIYDLCQKGEHFTARTLPETLRSRDIEFEGKRETARMLLKDLDFKYRPRDGRRYLMETKPVVLKRIRFLKEYKRLIHDEKRVAVFQDETWIFQKGATVVYGWEDKDIKSCTSRTLDRGTRFIVVHAGTAHGWVPKASLIFKSSTKTGDYHGQMNGVKYRRWLKEQVIPNIPEGAVFLIDNASYHTEKAT